MSTIYRQGLIKRIHVDKRVIQSNLKHGRTDPPITVQTSRGPQKFMEVELFGPARFIYSPDKPLSCGARLWIETTAKVIGKRTKRKGEK